MEYELVVGLETHIELSTKTKIFCSCSTKFGDAPNTHCCPVCIGLPGTLPRLNKTVVEYAVKAGISTHCKISEKSKMDRKNYVYPDLSKAYQISQYDFPLCYDGFLELSSGRKIRINRIHIEEDAGKLIHDNNDIYIDYNRGGVPLIEIVTEPDFTGADEVREYLEKLRLIMKYIGISDCKMQEGSMRCDINISVKKRGTSEYGTRTEIKNMNSLSMIVKAINAEYKRQIECIKSGDCIVQQTLRYNEADDITVPMRTKEDSDDYRYFREPDLPDIYVSKKEVETLKAEIPELPDEKIKRYIEDYCMNEKDARQIIQYPKIACYFENMVSESQCPKLCTNVMLTHIFRYLQDDDSKEKCLLNIGSSEIAKVIAMVECGEIPNNFLKQIIDKMLDTGKAFDELFDKSDFSQISFSELEAIIDKIILFNQKAVNDYCSGKLKAMASLIGMVMRETKGRADAKKVEIMIKEKLLQL